MTHTQSELRYSRLNQLQQISPWSLWENASVEKGYHWWLCQTMAQFHSNLKSRLACLPWTKQVFAAPRRICGKFLYVAWKWPFVPRIHNPFQYWTKQLTISFWVIETLNTPPQTNSPSLLLMAELHHPPHGSVQLSFWKGSDNRVSNGIILSRIGNNTFKILDSCQGAQKSKCPHEVSRDVPGEYDEFGRHADLRQTAAVE